jgi:light-regulated signal transduction histidine kinase (bacteriophytochrome)
MLYPIRRTLFFNIGMLLVVMAASFTLAAGITRMIIRALDKLKGHAQALGQGRLGHRTEVSGFSELSELAESFNQMAAQLQERRLAEEKALAELTRANQELDAFAYSTSHDLRGPLRSIDGFSQALLEDYHDKLDDEGKDYLQRVRASSQRMGHLIDDLLKLSRVTRARMRAERVDLTRLAEGITEELARNEPGRVVEFVICRGLTAEGDESLLRIVLQNLLENAWKFTRNRAQSKVEFGIAKLENGPVYFVRDNGAGFNMAYSDKLFGAFQRLHSSSEFPGTGIGLATVQRIIHRHAGRIWAEGEVGKGATFYFTLNSDSARS